MEDGFVNKAPVRKRLNFYLELIPLLFICCGFILKYFGFDYWMEVLGLGAILAALLYLFFAWYLFKVDEYKLPEVILSVLSGLVFLQGILGLLYSFFSWDGGFDLLSHGLYGGLWLSVLTMVVFLFHLKDERASKFYRKLLARLLVFTIILLTFYPGLMG